MNLQIKKVGFLISAMVLGFASCSKEEVSVTPELTQAEVKEIVQENFIAEDLGNVLDKGFKIALREGKSEEMTSSCFLKNLASLSEDKKSLTLDFGSGCTTFLTGKELAGKLVITYSLLDKGYNRNVSFDGFSISGTKFQGNLFVENTLENANGNPHAKFNGNFSITLPSGKVISRKGSWAKEIVKGATLFDNEYVTTGSWESLSINGLKRSITITSPLKRKSLFTCGGVVTSGAIQLTWADKNYTLDFGDGTCDDKLTVTGPSGEPKTFSLVELLEGMKQ